MSDGSARERDVKGGRDWKRGGCKGRPGCGQKNKTDKPKGRKRQGQVSAEYQQNGRKHVEPVRRERVRVKKQGTSLGRSLSAAVVRALRLYVALNPIMASALVVGRLRSSPQLGGCHRVRSTWQVGGAEFAWPQLGYDKKLVTFWDKYRSSGT